MENVGSPPFQMQSRSPFIPQGSGQNIDISMSGSFGLSQHPQAQTSSAFTMRTGGGGNGQMFPSQFGKI